MSSSSVLVHLQPRMEDCDAVLQWYSESALLVCAFEYGAEPIRAPTTLAERLDAALNISNSPPRAILGDVQVMWRDAIRLRSIELRTAPAEWHPSRLPIPDEGTEKRSMTLGLDYDVDGIASVEVDVRVLRDAQRAIISLLFEQVDHQCGRWAAIADGAFVRVDDENRLMEFRFANLQMVSGDPDGAAALPEGASVDSDRGRTV